MKTTGALCILLTASAGVQGAELLKTERSWNGGLFRYPAGDPEATSITLALAEGEGTPWHCHPVPTFGHVVRGTLVVETLEGKRVELRQGESVVEVMGTLHRGHGGSGGAEVVVFYAGATSLPNTVLQSDPGSDRYCRPPQ